VGLRFLNRNGNSKSLPQQWDGCVKTRLIAPSQAIARKGGSFRICLLRVPFVHLYSSTSLRSIFQIILIIPFEPHYKAFKEKSPHPLAFTIKPCLFPRSLIRSQVRLIPFHPHPRFKTHMFHPYTPSFCSLHILTPLLTFIPPQPHHPFHLIGQPRAEILRFLACYTFTRRNASEFGSLLP